MQKQKKGNLIMNKIKAIGSIIFLFLFVACAYEACTWLDAIASWGLIDIISGGGIVIDILITVVLWFVFFTLFKSSLADNSYSLLLKDMNYITKEKIGNILYKVSGVIEIIAAVLFIALVISNLIDSGIDWWILYNTYIPVRLYLISFVVAVFMTIINPDLKNKEKPIKSFIKRLNRAIKDEDKSKDN